MQVNFSDNYFALFELPVQFDVNADQIETRYRTLQRVLHPDKFAQGSDAEKRWSMQAASFVNEGYQTLSKPLKRASYLLSLNGISVDEETDTNMSPMFLMEQMELREAIEAAPAAADPFEALDKIKAQLRDSGRATETEFAKASNNNDWQEGRTLVRQWQFLEKLLSEVKFAEAQLDDV